MQPIDWILVAVYVLALVVISSLMGRRANKGVDEFFVAGRSLPWWLMGTAVLANGFSSDTPLFITKLVRQYGLSGGWYLWNGSINGLICAFMIAHLWRRTRGVTDAEFRELRYSGAPGRAVRVLWAGYWSACLMFFLCAWVLLSMVKISKVVLGLPAAITVLGTSFDPSLLLVIGGCLAALTYTAIAGLWGDIIADVIQFAFAFVGTTVLGILSLREVGGLAALKAKITALPTAGAGFLDIIPRSGADSFAVFIAGLTFLWWSSAWSDGSMFVASRCMAARSGKQAQMGRYLGNFGQMAIIIWPWAITALCSIVLFPAGQHPDIQADPELAYPRMVLAVMPTGLRGLMVIAFLSAFMSAINMVVNACSTYLINDVYRRHWVKDASPRHYIWVGRLWMAVTLSVGGYTAAHSQSILGLSQLAIQFTSGVGGIFLLRWFWWRVNAWSEIAAYIASAGTGMLLESQAVVALLHRVAAGLAPGMTHPAIDGFFQSTLPGQDGWIYKTLIVVVVTMVSSLGVMLLTPPTEQKHLEAFCRKVRPYGPGWSRIRREMGAGAWAPDTLFNWQLLALGAVVFYAVWAGVGCLWLGHWGWCLAAATTTAVAGRMLYVRWAKIPDEAD